MLESITYAAPWSVNGKAGDGFVDRNAALSFIGVGGSIPIHVNPSRA